jgi:hypothetical protein
MNTQPLGVLCARALEMLGDRYEGDALVRTAALVIEVEHGEEQETLVTATDDRLWVQVAFLREGVVVLEREMDRQEEEEPE